MAAYNQALEEGYTPRQAKNILYNNVVSWMKEQSGSTSAPRG